MQKDDFQKKLLAGVIQDYTLYHKARRLGFSKDDFGHELLKSVWDCVAAAGDVGSYDVKTLKNYVLAGEGSVSDKTKIVTYIDVLASESLVGFDVSVDVLATAKAKNTIKDSIIKFIDAEEKGLDWSSSLDKMVRAINLTKTSKIAALPDSYFSRISIRNEQREAAYIGNADTSFKCVEELAPLQVYFKPFIAPETITTIEGKTNSGKSVLLINFLRCAIHPKNKLNCLYLYSENRAIEAEGRLDSLLLGVPYSEIKERKLTPKEVQHIYDMPKNGWGELFTQRLPYGHSNIDTIKRYLDELEEKGIKIHAIFLDSPDHMVSTKKTETWWLGKKAVYEEIKECAEAYSVSFFVTRQTKGETSSKELDAYSGSGGQSIPQLIDNQIIIDYDAKQEMLSGQRKLVLTKCRDGVLDFRRILFRIRDNLLFVPETSPGLQIMSEENAKVYKMAKPRTVKADF